MQLVNGMADRSLRSKQRLPCFNCVFPNSETYNNLEGCSEGGVLGPLPGIVGSIMAAEAIKYLLDIEIV